MADKNNTSLANYFLNQLLNQSNFVGKQQFSFGADTLTKSVGDVNYLQDFFKNILEGNDTGKLLDFVNTDDINKNYEQAVATASELAPRGGLRESTLGNLDFMKMKDVQNLLQQVKAKSPDALIQLASLLANIGSGSVAAGENAFGQNLQAVLGQLALADKDKDRKNTLLGGLISSAGAIAGAFAGKH